MAGPEVVGRPSARGSGREALRQGRKWSGATSQGRK